MKQGVLVLAIAALAATVWLWAGPGQGAAARPDYRHSSLTITRADGKNLSFNVEVAQSEAQHAYGLMFVKSLEPDAGMIFLFDPPREVSFWMKNTLIPLDMLFVRADHTIGHIAANARPLDLGLIPSDGPVAAVIEIKGGQAGTDDIAVGDRVDFADLPAIKP